MTIHKAPSLNNFTWQQSVKDKDTLTPPGSPAKGDRYLISGIGAGGWTGKDNQIATCSNATGPVWEYVTPTEGMITWVEDENVYYKYITSWTVLLASDLMQFSHSRHKVGSTTRSTTTATGTQAITGIGFQPKGIIFFATIGNTVGNASFGITDGITDGSVYPIDNDTPDAWNNASQVIHMTTGNGSNSVYSATLASMDADGFTITWTKGSTVVTGQTITIKYLAIR